MADITVRKIRFGFDEPIDFDGSDEMLGAILGPLALSMTMPYLEPYLIRTMKVAPWYDPAKIEIPEGVDALLARYSAMAANAASPESPALSTVPHG